MALVSSSPIPVTGPAHSNRLSGLLYPTSTRSAPPTVTAAAACRVRACPLTSVGPRLRSQSELVSGEGVYNEAKREYEFWGRAPYLAGQQVFMCYGLYTNLELMVRHPSPHPPAERERERERERVEQVDSHGTGHLSLSLSVVPGVVWLSAGRRRSSAAERSRRGALAGGPAAESGRASGVRAARVNGRGRERPARAGDPVASCPTTLHLDQGCWEAFCGTGPGALPVPVSDSYIRLYRAFIATFSPASASLSSASTG
jgi:hypothetical protein